VTLLKSIDILYLNNNTWYAIYCDNNNFNSDRGIADSSSDICIQGDYVNTCLQYRITVLFDHNINIIIYFMLFVFPIRKLLSKTQGLCLMHRCVIVNAYILHDINAYLYLYYCCTIIIENYYSTLRSSLQI
jgi:hypothetical protein